MINDEDNERNGHTNGGRSAAGPSTDRRPSLVSEVFAQFADLFDLVALEWRYEIGNATRKLMVFGVAIIFALTAFALLQISIVVALMKTGLSVGIASLILAVVYAGIAAVFIFSLGQRDPQAGAPFEATQREVKENLRWIQKLFS